MPRFRSSVVVVSCFSFRGSSVTVLLTQERGLLRSFNIDMHPFLKYMFVIEANYHKTNPYHNAVHGADVMQACHVLLGYPVVEVCYFSVLTSLLLLSLLYIWNFSIFSFV